MYMIDEVFEILSKNKLTSYKETVRNWVRKGVIQAEPLESRKKAIGSVWRRSKHTWGHATPRVPYLHGYFMFEGERIPFNKDFVGRNEQIIHALIEKIRLDKVNRKRK